MSVIISLGKAVPDYKYKQHDILQYMLQVPEFNDSRWQRKLSLLYERSGITNRYSAIPDFDEQQHQKKAVLFTENNSCPAIQNRLAIYHNNALKLAQKAVNNCMNTAHKLNEVTHLITVSCTGMSAPGLDLRLMQLLQLKNNVHRTSINFMGCYAAFHGLKQAKAICESDEKAKVLVVCVELCTLHFQPDADMDNIMANMLFADGAAAVLLCSDKQAKEQQLKGLKIKDMYAEVLFEGEEDMAWNISDKGFLMRLSAYIPQLIKGNINGLINNALAHAQIQKDQITDWAIHPGGKKIVEVIATALQLNNNDVQASFEVLKNYGNMSSPTILFVLIEMWQSLINKQATIFAVGFGPGLTMETAVLERV